jgi:hypothetical protein
MISSVKDASVLGLTHSLLSPKPGKNQVVEESRQCRREIKRGWTKTDELRVDRDSGNHSCRKSAGVNPASLRILTKRPVGRSPGCMGTEVRYLVRGFWRSRWDPFWRFSMNPLRFRNLTTSRAVGIDQPTAIDKVSTSTTFAEETGTCSPSAIQSSIYRESA